MLQKPPGSSKVEAPSEDGMVATGVLMSVANQQDDAKLYVSERSVSARPNQDVLEVRSTFSVSNRTTQNSSFANLKSMAMVTGVNQQDGENNLLSNGHTQCISKPTENGYLLEEPKTEMEGFIMRDHDIDVIQEPVVEVNSVVTEPSVNDTDLQPELLGHHEADAIDAHSLAPQKRKVQWIDEFGKELVQVLEYEASDTGDSEEDDDADSHVCACTIQ